MIKRQLNARQVAVLEYVCANPMRRAIQIEVALQVDERRLRDSLSQLRARGLVEKVREGSIWVWRPTRRAQVAYEQACKAVMR